MLLALTLGCTLGGDPVGINDPDPGDDTGEPATDDSAGPGDDTGEPADDSGDDTATDDTGDTQPPESDDHATFQQILDGTLSPDEGLLAIANSGGWPIESDEGWTFVALDEGQSSLSLAGDHADWELQPMAQQAGIWWITVPIETPEGSGYKFVEGSDDYQSDPWARAYSYDEYGEITYVRGAGGHLERWFQIGDATFSGRMIRVWVPSGAVTRQLYAHDGQNLFDPYDAPWGGWHLQDNLGSQTMAIGIDNGEETRLDEYGHVTDYNGKYGGQGDDYAAYVMDTVRPLIEAEYGTAGVVGTLGSSMGGLIALNTAVLYPGEWDFVATMSGTLWWGSGYESNETILERWHDAGYWSIAVYVDSGGYVSGSCVDTDGDGLNDDADDADNYCENRQFADQLADDGWTWESDLWHWHEANATHDELAWADRVWRPIQIFEGL